MILILQAQATPAQMLIGLGIYIKVAVDIQRGILAGGGEFHADCARILLKDGSEQSSIWGTQWQ